MLRKRSRLEEEEECLVRDVKRACTESSRRIVEDRRREAAAEQNLRESRRQNRRRKCCEPSSDDCISCTASKRTRAVSISSPVCDAALDPSREGNKTAAEEAAWQNGFLSGLKKLEETVQQVTQENLKVTGLALEEYKRIYHTHVQRQYDQELGAALSHFRQWPQWQQ